MFIQRKTIPAWLSSRLEDECNHVRPKKRKYNNGGWDWLCIMMAMVKAIDGYSWLLRPFWGDEVLNGYSQWRLIVYNDVSYSNMKVFIIQNDYCKVPTMWQTVAAINRSLGDEGMIVSILDPLWWCHRIRIWYSAIICIICYKMGWTG